MSESDKTTYKLILLVRIGLAKGACAVGKSSILQSFLSDKFNPTYQPTIWDCYRIVKNFDGEEVELEIIDTAGLEGPNSPLTKRDLFTSQSRLAFILVYDICDSNSYRISIEMLQNIKLDSKRSKVREVHT